MFQFDFVTKRGLSHYSNENAHYMVGVGVCLKFVGYRADGQTDWLVLGEKTADFIRRDILIQEIEAGLHD